MQIQHILLIDNNDSFTYNLVQIFRENCGCKVDVISQAGEYPGVTSTTGIVFSPGPGLPHEYPLMSQILDRYKESNPILGICLGHQAIAGYFGWKLYNTVNPLHGYTERITVQYKDYLFNNLPAEQNVGLYHSWAVEPDENAGDLYVTSFSEKGVIMSLAHRSLDIRGVQFHPESYMTEFGVEILQNWVAGITNGGR
ncbi:MAG: aminodeoxychorismate/anthranilate synthase component II [Ignavibacteria bacterium]|nr:aminodeoxychorismate/anthranilate synthase component II [Ignavibacteria bacterium]